MSFLTNAADKIKSFAGVAKFKVTKASPEILMFVGGATIVGGVIVACKQTIKAVEIMEDHDKTMNAIEEATEQSEKLNYNVEDRKRDLITLHVQTGLKLAKTYAPAVALVGTGLLCFAYSHRIIKKRNLDLMAAYAALDKAYKEYRKRVADKIGEEEEKAIYYNYERQDIKDVEGVEDCKDAKVFNADGSSVDGYSVYSRFFDETSELYSRDPLTNKMTLINVQNWANRVLNTRGYLFLNEVYTELGFDITPEGQIVGWLKGNGDGYVDFKIFNGYRRPNREFVNGLEPVVLLDFNVDGPIYDKI